MRSELLILSFILATEVWCRILMLLRSTLIEMVKKYLLDSAIGRTFAVESKL